MKRTMRKTLVEDCAVLDVRRLLKARANSGGADRWRLCLNRGAEIVDLRCTLISRPRLRVRLEYTADAEQVSYSIKLNATSPHFGGRRWWLLCPLERDGEACGRRARSLYMPPGETHFGCRSCHELTYRSSQAPAISRLRGVAQNLAVFEELLRNGKPLNAIAAIGGARVTIENFLAQMEAT